MSEYVSDSRFNMWRALFALTHADGVITSEEIEFMRSAMEKIAFSPDQRHQLSQDMAQVQNIHVLFDLITDTQDQLEFFNIAKEIVYADGDYGADEQNILIQLQERHNQRTNVDDLIGKVSSIELETPIRKAEPVYIQPENTPKNENKLLNVLQKIFGKLT